MLGLLVDANSCLHLYVNGMDQGAAAQDIPSPCYPFIDLYGQCEQVSGLHPPADGPVDTCTKTVEEQEKCFFIIRLLHIGKMTNNLVNI